MYRISCLLVAGFITGASLISMTSPAAAEGNCPTGATCNCVPTSFTKCTKVDAQGHPYDCTTTQGETCTVVSGPGSGKATKATTTVAQPDKGTVTQPDKGKAVRPKNVAPSRLK